MPMEQMEFEFPDEKEVKEETKQEVKQADEIQLEIEDDTPEEDRGREPLPKHIVEELDNDDLDEYSEKVKIRLKQMKKVWHDERREKERALREQQEAIALAQRIMEENKTLKGKLSEGEKSYLDTYKSAANLELEQAKREYKEAYDSGDADRLVEAQQKLSEAQFKIQKAKEYVPTLQVEKDDVKSEPQTQVVRPDPRAVAWQERNTWFGQDEEMTSLALGLHQKLVNQYGASYTSTDEYWSKIDDTMRRRFPDYFQASTQQTQETKPAPRTEKPSTVVAPATRSTSSKKVTLKQSQLAIAKRLGLSPEQYARELMKMEANNG